MATTAEAAIREVDAHVETCRQQSQQPSRDQPGEPGPEATGGVATSGQRRGSTGAVPDWSTCSGRSWMRTPRPHSQIPCARIRAAVTSGSHGRRQDTRRTCAQVAWRAVPLMVAANGAGRAGPR